MRNRYRIRSSEFDRATQRETVPEPQQGKRETSLHDEGKLSERTASPEIVGRLKSIFSPNHKKQQKDPRKAAFVRGKNTLLTTRI
jgi:hypothetical protein